jgi:hypothetical protein
MRVRLKCVKEVFDREDGTLEIEIPGIQMDCLDLGAVQMADHKSGKARSMNTSEQRDFDEAVEAFIRIRAARALAEYMEVQSA